MEKNQDTALPRAKPNIFDAAHDSDAEAEGAQHTRSRRPGKNSRSDGTSTNTSNEVPKHRSHSPIYSSKYGISRPRELLSPHVHAYAHAHSYSIDTDPMQSSSESIGIVMAKKPRERHRHEQLAREDSPPTNATSVSGRPRNHFDTPECASSYASRISSFYQEEGSRPGTHGTVRSGHSYERDVYNGPASVSACLTMRQGGKSPDVSQTSTAKPLSGSGSGFGHHSDHDASFDESFYFQQVTGFTSTGAAPTGVGGGSLGEEFHDARTSSSSLYVPPSTGNRNHNRSRKAPDVQAAIDTAISSTESSGSGSLRHSRTRTPHLQTRMQTSNERYVEQQPQPRRNLIGAGKMIEGKMQNEQAAHEEQREIHRQGIRDAGAYVQRIPTELGDPDDTSTRWPESMFLGVRSEVSSESPSMVRGYMGRRPRAKYQGLGAVVEGNGEDEAARREAFKEMIVRDFHRRCITINREANRAKVAIDRDTDKSQMQKEREKQHIERVRIMRINRAKDESGYNVNHPISWRNGDTDFHRRTLTTAKGLVRHLGCLKLASVDHLAWVMTLLWSSLTRHKERAQMLISTLLVHLPRPIQ